MRETILKLFPLMILNALVIIGVHKATRVGEVGEPIARKLDDPDWLRKPTIGCMPCMPSVWGTLVFWTIGPRNWLLWPFYVLALSGLMRFVVQIDHKLK